MFQQRLIDRPIVPVSYLIPLSSCSIHESREMIGATPVCISMEPVSMNIEDFVMDIDFRTKRRRSVGV